MKKKAFITKTLAYETDVCCGFVTTATRNFDINVYEQDKQLSLLFFRVALAVTKVLLHLPTACIFFSPCSKSSGFLSLRCLQVAGNNNKKKK